jgi:hypothetical protein
MAEGHHGAASDKAGQNAAVTGRHRAHKRGLCPLCEIPGAVTGLTNVGSARCVRSGDCSRPALPWCTNNSVVGSVPLQGTPLLACLFGPVRQGKWCTESAQRVAVGSLLAISLLRPGAAMSLRERVRRLSGERRVERQMTEAQRQFAWRRMVLKAQFVMRHVHATDTLQYLMPVPSATDAPASSSANAGTAHCALAGGVDNRGAAAPR